MAKKKKSKSSQSDSTYVAVEGRDSEQGGGEGEEVS